MTVMPWNSQLRSPLAPTSLLALLTLAIGCHAPFGTRVIDPHHPQPLDMPRELAKTSLPPYVLEPPDILVIEAIHLVPLPPYRLRTGDAVAIQVEGTPPEYPITGAYAIEPGGIINLGVAYGSVRVTGMTSEEAQAALQDHLATMLESPSVTVSLLQMAGTQQIAGQHLVGPDGTVTLGTYGSVYVVGMTLEEAKLAIETHLSQFLEDPEVALDVFAYNSKSYYIVTQGAGLGDGVTKFPITGNDTVLDAIANINGLTQLSSKRIWIARPSHNPGEVQILPVDWQAITAHGVPATNYQVLPGDRVFIAEDKWVAFDTQLGKFTAPIERAMGFALLGQGTISRFYGNPLRFRGFGGGFGGGF
jgi:polysaccharide biosynthesis/export protein